MAAQSQLPKSKLVETAAELIYRQGWNATGINQILTEARVPKGSFYYYFHSKEDLGVAIVKYHGQVLQEAFDRTLLNSSIAAGDGIMKFFEEQVERQRRGEWRFGCPIGSFSNEVATSTEKITAACREELANWVSALTRAIERGQRDGSVANRDGAEDLARRVSSAWQGSLVFMKTFREPAYLTGALECIRLMLFVSRA